MTAADDRRALLRKLEIGRLLGGSFVELLIKSYGAGAATAVAISDAETVGGKLGDAVAAVPTLVEEYRNASYVVQHREEIQGAITYLSENTPPQEELERTTEQSLDTLRDIETTYTELGSARDAIEFEFGVPRGVGDAIGHLNNAWNARPDLDSIRDLAAVSEQVTPLADQVNVLLPVYYGPVLSAMDNFASDEIVSTVSVMLVSLGLAVVLANAVGYWIRRGRPGLIAVFLQRWGAKHFRPWYADNFAFAFGQPVYDVAREHLQRDIVADPEQTLDDETMRALEAYFATRQRD